MSPENETLQATTQTATPPTGAGYSLIPPSANYLLNKSTFAYRLSESVFGSLLASYVLGFVGFVAVYVQPAKKFIIQPTQAQINVADFFNQKGELKLDAISKLLNIKAADVGPGISTVAQVPLYPDLVIILHYLVISTVFSIFTALVYFNYHRTIMHLTSDQKTSSYDFLLSVLIGFCFGLSMLEPLSVVFFIALLSSVAFWRKAVLLRPYWLDIAVSKNLVAAHSSAGDKSTHRRNQSNARKRVAKAFLNSNDETLKSWGAVANIPVWTGVIFAIVGSGSAVLFNWRVIFPDSGPVFKQTVLLCNLGICVLTIILLFIWLLESNRKMPASNTKAENDLNEAHIEAIANIPDKP